MKETFGYASIGLGLFFAAQLFAASPVNQPTVSTDLIPSGKIDLTADTLTLPLQQGTLKDGRKVWFVLTDTSDAQKAQDLGIVYAPALSNAAKAKSTRVSSNYRRTEISIVAHRLQENHQGE